jgi:hypothetical protein
LNNIAQNKIEEECDSNKKDMNVQMNSETNLMHNKINSKLDFDNILLIDNHIKTES